MGIISWLLVVYSVVLIMCIAFSYMEANDLDTSGWVKVIFWPITVIVFLTGLILWLLIWVPIKLFEGIRICLYEIKDFFVEVFDSAISAIKK